MLYIHLNALENTETLPGIWHYYVNVIGASQLQKKFMMNEQADSSNLWWMNKQQWNPETATPVWWAFIHSSRNEGARKTGTRKTLKNL